MKTTIYLVLLIVAFSCKNVIKNDSTAKNTGVPEHKKHPILPNKISVQLLNNNGEKLKLENVLCHLNIYIDSLSYYTYSFIPTDSNGIVNLTKEQLIQNTELKHYYDKTIPLDQSPVKFDFMIMDTNLINGMITGMKNYLSVDIESIKLGLKQRGLNDSQIALQITTIKEKIESDKKLLEILEHNQNAKLDYSNGPKKITDFWNSESEYFYELK
ncbi:hypothetical protein [uncultured Tenacibaculum sp.]|uniref:hypothetical protein n=1 Tax=uncultured Tenacibaculum sp. TaxID=174713 RepID=UPI00262FFEC6|nr:hypothetical protein [uncultured Tenacibaculum sp.]